MVHLKKKKKKKRDFNTVFCTCVIILTALFVALLLYKHCNKCRLSDHMVHRGAVTAGNSDIVASLFTGAEGKKSSVFSVHEPAVHQPAVHRPAVHQPADLLADAGSRKTGSRRLSSFLFLLTPLLNLPDGT